MRTINFIAAKKERLWVVAIGKKHGMPWNYEACGLPVITLIAEAHAASRRLHLAGKSFQTHFSGKLYSRKQTPYTVVSNCNYVHPMDISHLFPGALGLALIESKSFYWPLLGLQIVEKMTRRRKEKVLKRNTRKTKMEKIWQTRNRFFLFMNEIKTRISSNNKKKES